VIVTAYRLLVLGRGLDIWHDCYCIQTACTWASVWLLGVAVTAYRLLVLGLQMCAVPFANCTDCSVP
jgi:hypothetical protein